MASWISRQTASKFQQMDKLHDTGGDEEFSNDFPLDGLADSLDNPRLYHCSPGSCDANNNIKMRDPLLCLGSVPPFLTHQPTSCVDGGHVDKSNIVYHTMASQSNLSAANSAQTSSITQSDWSNIITTVNFGQFYDTPFQYVLNAATTPCSKISDESLTYLNQGQSYELKLKKIGEATYAEQYFMSIVRVIFHERRLQYMEKEQLDTWKQTRPGERILDIDIPLSYGLVDVKIDPEQLSCLHFVWDSNRESSGVYIKLNAISTEFTAKRHGGEKGVPFRIQVETYALPSSYVQPHSSSSASFSTFSDISTKLVHCGSCQVKVFKPKGADRKYKTDREKIEKKSESEKEKYQPSFDYTVLTEIPLDQVRSYLEQQSGLNKPSVSSTSVDCNVSPPSTHFHPLKQPTHTHPFTQDAFFPQTCNEAVVLGSPSYHLLGSNISGPRTSHHMEDNVFHDHNGSLQSSINDFQRIQQLYHQPNNNNNDNNNNNINNNNNNVVVVPTSEQETNFMNCFSYNDIHKSPPSPVRNRSVSRLHETNECTVSVITPSNNPRSPAGGEVKRVIYSPYTSTRLTSIHTPSLLQCQIRSPASPNISMDGFKKKDEALKATSSTSLPTSPVIQKSDATSPLRQTHSPIPGPSNEGHLMPQATQSFKAMGDQVIPNMDSIQVEQWLARNRFDNCIDHFRDFTGADLLRLTRDDLIQICGVINGIRLNNALHSKPIRPKLTLYVAAIGKLAERKVVPGELRSNLELTSSDSSSSSSSSLHIEVIQKNRKRLKRSRTPDINRLENICGRDDNDDDDEVADSLMENQTKKCKESSDFVKDGDSEVHAVFMETVTIENLVLKLCSIFLLNPNQIKCVYMKKDGDRMNVIVNDLVLQNLSDGLKIGVDIRDHVQGSVSIQLISMN